MKPAFQIFLALSAPAQILQSRIDSVLADSPFARRAHWGLVVVDFSANKPVYSHNPDHLFVPASNTKLFSTALALTRLGPDHRFVTRLHPSGPISQEGVLQGSLLFTGGGDPTLSGRPIPYQRGIASDPLGPLQQLVDSAWRAGLRRITGDIIGDDRHYIHEPYSTGWSIDDTVYEYGAPVSALILHDNFLRLHLRAGSDPGEPVVALFQPPIPYFSLDARVTTSSRPQTISVDRPLGSRHILVSGNLKPDAAVAQELAVDDPARYAAFALRHLLVERGIRVDGAIGALHRSLRHPPPAEPLGVEIARRTSPPLLEILKTVNKVSQNLHAEIVLREVARIHGNQPSRQAGLSQLIRFLASIGIDGSTYRFQDASGLSRLTLVSPTAIVTLLRHMYQSSDRDAWIDLLPISAHDGSLYLRFRDVKSGRVMAKTGTLSHTGALSGYIENSQGRVLAFSMLVNNANATGADIREFIDKVVTLLVE